MKRTIIIQKKTQRERLRAFPLYRRVELVATVLAAAVVILAICLIVALVAKRATAIPEATQTQESVTTAAAAPEEITATPETEGTVVSIRFVYTKTTETSPEVVETLEVVETEQPVETAPQESAWDRAFAAAKASVDMADARILALSIQGEAALARTTAEKAAVAWVILNAIECGEYGLAAVHSVADVVKNPDAIQGYTSLKKRGVEPDTEYIELAIDVLARYAMERAGWEWTGRVIPSTYHWWMGDGYRTNYFCDVYHHGSLATAQAHAWDWSWTSPYDD